MNKLPTVSILAIATLVTACSGPMPMAHSPQFAPVTPLPRENNKQATGAIFATDSTDLWQAKRRDYRIGDIITVLLSESTQANRSLNNETSRESANDAIPSGLTTALQKLDKRLEGLKVDGAMNTGAAALGVDDLIDAINPEAG